MKWLLILVPLGLIAQTGTNALSDHARAASAYMQAGDFAAAERENRTIIKLQPGLAEAHVNLGLSCFLQKHYLDAAVAFEKGLNLNSNLDNARLFLGLSQFKLNRVSAALPLLEKYVSLQPADFQGQYYLGLSYLSLERWSDARIALGAASRIEARNADVLYHLAQTYIEEARKDQSKATELAVLYQNTVDRISEIDPNSFRLAQLRAAIYERDGKKTLAIAELEKILENDPKARGIHYTLGCLYMEKHDYTLALEQFQAEQQLDTPYYRTDLQIGHTYLALEDPSKALPFLEKALQLEPDNDGVILVDFGRAYRLMNQPAKSVAAYEKAITKGQRTAAVYYQLAMESKKAGNLTRSSEALAMSQKLRASGQESQVSPTSSSP